MKTIEYNHNTNIEIELEDLLLRGILYVPDKANAIVMFAHGSGSSRLSVRNQYVARHLNEMNLATLLFDLLTEDEEIIDLQTREYRFDIPLLAKRLVKTTDWLKQQPILQNLSLGYFGSSTGAAAALIAADNRPDSVNAVVSRGGRPDLAADSLANVIAPTLLIVGALDTEVIRLNQEAKAQMQKIQISELSIVQGATHLFEEPGKLEEVVALAGAWFQKHLSENQR